MAKDLTPDAWLTGWSTSGGTAQIETATAAGTITGNGDATVIVTAAGVTGSPITVPVAVLNTDTASAWATKVRTALGLNAAITALYTVGGSTTSITLTRTIPAANDATLNISLDNGTCTGITTALTSANTTAGVAPTSIVIPLSAITNLAATEADVLTGDIRSIMSKLLATIFTAREALITANKPTTFTLAKSVTSTKIEYMVRFTGSTGDFVPGSET